MIWQVDDEIRAWLPRIQCHRGRWVEGFLQNSVQSIQKAYECGYEICEFDVRLTADQKVILFHDAELKGRKVSDLMLAEIEKEIPISTLEELFIWFSKTEEFKLNIEIKNGGVFNYSLEQAVCSLVADFNLESRVLISSFNPLSLAKVRYYSPAIYRALLLTFENESGNNWFVKSGLLNFLCRPHMLNVRYQDYLDFKSAFKAVCKKIPVVLWTVNDLKIYDQVQDEVHGIISDEITPATSRKN